ncbi:GlsB/YeaQ/YmgE family stress response membrane protein [Paracidovorax sp. MALMAid1276]|uniref:GlsB/YeaQ/YmgE family stress response membrane protein n=1 Tax=Paracidovorax sp. MALMAid1276 TaxID=3411631 RepID=UPI003B9D1AE6
MPSLLGMLLIGLATALALGLLAHAVRPGRDRQGWIMMFLLGVAGSFLASYIGLALNWYQDGGLANWLVPVAGASTLVVLFGFFKGR